MFAIGKKWERNKERNRHINWCVWDGFESGQESPDVGIGHGKMGLAVVFMHGVINGNRKRVFLSMLLF